MAINRDEMIRKLQTCAPYTEEPFPFQPLDLTDPARSGEIRRYFGNHAGLNLDGIAGSGMSTWEKALTVSRFVSEHIPHDNQKEPMQELNAVTLWEYAQRVPGGFNCRWHAILLSELLLSIDIKNRFVTCLPEDESDQDCHVVNQVWLPEMSKWAMIDSDMQEYATGADGIPLSLEEMRAELIAGRRLNIHRNSDPDGVEYMQGYWAKNLYWFSIHTTFGYDLEGGGRLPDCIVNLIPPGFHIPEKYSGFSANTTSNAAAFWQGYNNIPTENPFVYYRLDSIKELKRDVRGSVRDLDWHRDLAAIQKFYARFTDTPINPDEFDQIIGAPAAIMDGSEIVSFAIPLSFRDGETEIGGAATIPERRNKGFCKALIAEMAFRILESGKAVTLTTEKGNLPMRAAAAAIGMKEATEKGNEAGVNDGATVEKQYKTADKLNTRISIHSKYSTNKQGFGNWITAHYQIRDGMSVLELGCGTGDMWVNQGEIIRRCSRFVLSDFSEGMLNKAKEKLRNQTGIEYRIIDIQDIPFEDQAFDAVIANMMLYHVPDLQKGLREVRRVLKTDGTFYCATYGEHGMMEYIYSLFAAYHIQGHVNDNFTLQNGEEKLKTFFPDVRRLLYQDSLEVTDAEDMADYIFSLTGMTDLQKLPREEVLAVLEKNMPDGVLHVPKEYGMFITGKRL